MLLQLPTFEHVLTCSGVEEWVVWSEEAVFHLPACQRKAEETSNG